jgi:purine-cytosine permease-like protein
MNAVDIGPIAPGDRRQPAFDLFLIFACANIVATTFQTGASLVPAFSLLSAVGLVAIGSLAGSAIIALLSAVGPRLGVPSVIAARAALGMRGAGLVAVLLYLTNFAWIAVNNVIAASACARIAGGAESVRAWAVGLGAVSTLIVAGGPRLVARADRLAVPLLAVVGVVLTIACLRLPGDVLWAPGTGTMSWLGGLDIVVGYQVSWILMFADYTRYTASARRAGAAVFLGLALTSLWLMPLGAMAARAASSTDPGTMLDALRLGVSGAVLMTVATVTTNFVNIYMSSLALRSLVPRASDQLTVWSTGLIGAALSLFSGAWLDRYASFMVVLGGVLVPVGGILLARFYLLGVPVSVDSLYDDRQPAAGNVQHAKVGGNRVASGTSVRRCPDFDVAGIAAWAAGGAAYYLASGVGGTMPALAVAVGVYLALKRGPGFRNPVAYRVARPRRC